MTQEEMKALSKSAAHSITIVTFSHRSPFISEAVETFLAAYEYTMHSLKNILAIINTIIAFFFSYFIFYSIILIDF